MEEQEKETVEQIADVLKHIPEVMAAVFSEENRERLSQFGDNLELAMDCVKENAKIGLLVMADVFKAFDIVLDLDFEDEDEDEARSMEFACVVHQIIVRLPLPPRPPHPHPPRPPHPHPPKPPHLPGVPQIPGKV